MEIFCVNQVSDDTSITFYKFQNKIVAEFPWSGCIIPIEENIKEEGDSEIAKFPVLYPTKIVLHHAYSFIYINRNRLVEESDHFIIKVDIPAFLLYMRVATDCLLKDISFLIIKKIWNLLLCTSDMLPSNQTGLSHAHIENGCKRKYWVNPSNRCYGVECEYMNFYEGYSVAFENTKRVVFKDLMF